MSPSVFDRDILYGGKRLDQEFEIGDGIENAAHFILHDAKVLGEVTTDIGVATKTGLVVSHIDKPDEAISVGTLSGPIAAKFAGVDDLKSDPKMPALVAVFTTPASREGYNDATVLQFVSVWEGDRPSTLPILEVVNETPLDETVSPE